MPNNKKLFPGVSQKQVEEKDRAEKLRQAQESLAEAARQEQAEKDVAYKKYTPKPKGMAKRIAAKMPDWLTVNVIANAALFILGSAMWVFASNTREFDPEYDDPNGPYTGPYLDSRTYVQAAKDANWPMRNGEFSPELEWYITASWLTVIALITLGAAASVAKDERQADINKSHKQIDVMLEIEKLAKEHNLDATAAKKMLNVAPQIIKGMSADSRVYFDMMLDGKVAIADKNFVNIATAVMAGHLQTHPEDMEQIMTVFDERSIPQEILNLAAEQKRQH